MADTQRRLRIAIIAPRQHHPQFNDLLLKAVQPVLPPDVDVSVHNLTQGHDCIQNRTNWLQMATRCRVIVNGCLNKTRALTASGKATLICCGVEAAREVIDIPIIGGFPTSARLPLFNLSQRFGIFDHSAQQASPCSKGMF